MENKLVVILGAGFSRPMGLPLAFEIKERFDRNQIGKLLNFSSGEWMWADGKRDVDKHNGSINPESWIYSYILNEVIQRYKKEKGAFDNYEQFYQWVQDISKIKKIRDSIYEKAKSELIKEYPSINDFEPEYEGDIHPFLFRFTNDSDLSNINKIINYLIADLLGFTQSKFDSAISEYRKFVTYIKNFDKVEIYTLNHDLLLENILEYFGIEFSRGFTKKKSEIRYQDNDTPIAVFKDLFDKPINIYKLHGSLDYFRFEHFIQGDKMYLEPTGNYNYFTTRNYGEKHYAIRVNPETGETLQDANFDIVPKFITGTNKSRIIQNDLMYSRLFERFENSLKEVSKVLISGYSFGDDHINEHLRKRDDLVIINQNPTEKYPFSSNSITNINSLNNL